MSFDRLFTRFTAASADLAGRPIMFISALIVVIVWALSGPYFNFSDTWQLIINTGTTILTNLLVFLVQATTNRDSIAIQAKLDELLDIDTRDHRKMIGIERMTLNELEKVREEIERRVRAAV